MESLRKNSTAARHWLSRAWLPLALYGVLLALLAFTASATNRAAVVVLALCLIAVDLWLGRTAGTVRPASREPNNGRVVVAGVIVAIGLVLAGGSLFGPVPDWLGFVGLGFTVQAAGGLISEARHSRLIRFGASVLLVAFAIAAAGVIFHVEFTWVVIALLLTITLADLGIELRTEGYLQSPREQRAVPAWQRIALGIVTVAIAVGMLRAFGASPTVTAVVLIITAGVVVLAAADTTSLAVVILVVVALVWASTPRTVDQPASTEVAQGQPYFLVLGDSYISGEGAHGFFSGTNTTKVNDDHTNQCRRAPTAWPILLAQDPSRPSAVPARVLDLPCSGALTCHIQVTARCHDDKGNPIGPQELAEFDRARTADQLGAPAFVVISVGGNDAGFGTIAETCIAPGNCTELMSKFLNYLSGDAYHEPVEQRLFDTYQAVRSAVGPDVPILAIPYPQPVALDTSCDLLLNRDERRFVDGFVQVLDGVIESAAKRAGVYYVDTVPNALIDSGTALCSQVGGGHGLNFLTWNPKAGSLWDALDPANWTHNNVHPNEVGHRVLLGAVVSWLEAHPSVFQQPQASSSPGTPPMAIPASVPGVPLGAVGQCTIEHGTDSPLCDTDNNGWMYDRTLEVLRLAFLPIVLAAAGLWILLTVPYSWIRGKGFTLTGFVIDAWHKVRH